MSCPTVEWFPAMAAIFSLVPTPSVLATRILSLPGEAKNPPKEPISLRTPAVLVDFTIFLMEAIPFIFWSMSTPAAAYADVIFFVVSLLISVS